MKPENLPDMEHITASPIGDASDGASSPYFDRSPAAPGLDAALERYRREPTAGADAIYLEAVSLAFNERVGLLAKGRLIDAVRQAGLTEVIRQYQDRVHTTEHGLCEVQRVARPANYTMNQASYDLARLRVNGLITRIPAKNRYRLTSDELCFAIFYTKVHDRLLRPCSPQTSRQLHLPYEKRCTPLIFTSQKPSIRHACCRRQPENSRQPSTF